MNSTAQPIDTPPAPDDPYFGLVGHGATLRTVISVEMMKALISNPARYKYIANLISRREITQAEATRKNTSKAVKLADALIEELGYAPQIEFDIEEVLPAPGKTIEIDWDGRWQTVTTDYHDDGGLLFTFTDDRSPRLRLNITKWRFPKTCLS